MNVVARPLLGALLGLALVACGDPCKELAQKICRCETGKQAESNCLQRVDAEAQNVEVTDKQNDRCADLLDQCTCKKLNAGDLAACGLAEDNGD